MIVIDTSVIPMPGKNAEFVALVKEAVAYLDQRWPLSPSRMVTVDLLDGSPRYRHAGLVSRARAGAGRATGRRGVAGPVAERGGAHRSRQQPVYL